MIKHIFNELTKNIKIIFRNWSSLSLLIISPLVLILLMGYIFSGEEVSGITLGVVSGEKIGLAPLAENISAYAVIKPFSSVEECLPEMALQKIHLCIVLEGMALQEQDMANITEFPSGKVTYYYDNTRKRISLALIKNIQDFFGLKAEQISIESTESIIENIQGLVAYLYERKADISQIKNESIAIRAELVERKEKLEQARASFLPSYFAVKDAQARLHSYSSAINSSSKNLEEEIRNTILVLHLYRNATSNLPLASINNLTDSISHLGNSSSSLEAELLFLSGILNSTNSEINYAIADIDSIVGELDKIKITLDEEIARNEEYIRRIDQNIERIDEASRELEHKLEQLSRLQPEAAEKLIKPILYDYNKLLENVKNIQISFPQLLVLIIMFIALLFSNISTLMEIHNRAYLRNLIAPVDDIVYLLGLLFTGIIVVFFQIAVLFAVAQAKLGIAITKIFWQISLIAILLIAVFVLLGMIFAYLLKTVQSSILVTTLSSLILFLFSNALLPAEAMPDFARFLSSYNPIVIGEYIVREVQLFNIPISHLLPQILLLVIYVCTLFLLAVILAKYKNRQKG